MSGVTELRRIGGSAGLELGAFDPTSAGDRRSIAEWELRGEAAVLHRRPDGLQRSDTVPFATRLVVDAPADPADACGDVVVEWLNVTVGSDHAFDHVRTHVEMRRTGVTWVGVSAQAAGIEPGTGAFGRPTEGLREADPDRYGSLHHPGDTHAQDIFALAVGAIRNRPEITGGPVGRVLAMGHSQSATMLTRHALDVGPHHGLIDGYLIHGRGAGAPPLDGSIPPLIAFDEEPVTFPTGSPVPILQVLAETDVVALGAFRARQPDHERLVTWEVAGGAHVDTYLLRGSADDGRPDREGRRAMWEPSSTCFGERLERPMNSGPQRHAMAAAIRALRVWVADGSRPTEAAPLEMGQGTLLRDGAGIALGGLRTPAVDAAIVRHSGTGNGGPAVSYLCGVTEPIPGARPMAEDEASERVRPHIDDALRRGAIVPEDAVEVEDLARIEAARSRG